MRSSYRWVKGFLELPILFWDQSWGARSTVQFISPFSHLQEQISLPVPTPKRSPCSQMSMGPCSRSEDGQDLKKASVWVGRALRSGAVGRACFP